MIIAVISHSRAARGLRSSTETTAKKPATIPSDVKMWMAQPMCCGLASVVVSTSIESISLGCAASRRGTPGMRGLPGLAGQMGSRMSTGRIRTEP